MIDGYDCGIRYLDTHVGRILDFLEEQGVLEDTAIIVTSDHGENMGNWESTESMPPPMPPPVASR